MTQPPDAPRATAPRRRRWVWRALVVVLFVSAGPPLFVRFVDPPATFTMVQRAWEHGRETGSWRWVDRTALPLEDMGRWAPRAAVLSEDQFFFFHHGFDYLSIRRAIDARRRGEDAGGASTLSQQTARNLFLWQGGGWFRKGVEAWLTVWLELLVPKERILELYLGVAETGPMTFGFEAGAQHWYGRSAAELEPLQAAALAGILPSPRRWRPSDAHVQRRARMLMEQWVPFPGEPQFEEAREQVAPLLSPRTLLTPSDE